MSDVNPTELKALHEATEKAFAEMRKGVDKSQEIAEQAVAEVKKYGTLTGETNTKLGTISGEVKALSETLEGKVSELKARTLDLEQKMAHRPGQGGEIGKSVGEIFADSPELKDMVERSMTASKEVKVGSIRSKTAIINATGQNQPLVPTMYFPGITYNPEQRLAIRDLLTVISTDSNLITWVKETAFTNNAGPQWDASSPTPGQEGAVKPESGITFELNTTPVTTLAHWIPVSRQVLADAKMLRGYIDKRMMYGLKLEEEDEILNGDGTAGTLTGLKAQDTDFTGGATNASAIDTLLRAINQVRLAFYEPNGIIMHPTDWMNILLLKDTQGRYLFGDPHSATPASIWTKPVVATVSQTLGTFTVGAFDRAAVLIDREDATIRVSEHHADFFIRNMVAILCEERLALLVTRPAAIVSGALSYAG